MKKLAVCILMAGLLALTAMKGCSCKREELSQKVDPDKAAATLVWTVWDGDSYPVYQQLIDSYEKLHPEISIKLKNFSSDHYNMMLESELESGGGKVDLMMVKSIPGYVSMSRKKLLEPLEGIDTSRFYMAEDLIFEGKLYAVPCRMDFQVLYYNKKLFDIAGMEYPSNDMTLEEYDKMVRQVSERATKVSGTKIYGTHYHTWRSLIQDFMILDGQHTLLDGDYDFLEPVYEMVLRQQEDGICQPYLKLELESLHYSAAFYQNNVAVMPMGTWFIPMLIQAVAGQESQVTDWGIVSLPHPKGVGAGTSVGSIAAVSISSQSDRKKEAKDFVDYICGRRGAEIFARAGSIPAFREAAAPELISSMKGFPKDDASKHALNTKKLYLDLPVSCNAADINSILEKIHADMMRGTLSIRDGLDQMRENITRIQRE